MDTHPIDNTSSGGQLAKWLLPPEKADGSSKVLIELKNVVKTFHTPAGPFTALKNVSLQVNAGEFAAVIGKSGSGKSTLINMVTGIDRPSLGEVYVGGTPIHNLNEDRMAAWRGRSLGVIFQFFQLLPTLTLVENVMLPMELCGTYPRQERRERAMHLLSLVGLSSQANKFPSAVSGGQQQRVAIARSLANDPNILIADEPTGSLDSKTADSIFMLFEDFVRQGRTILMVTHDRDLASRVSRVILIADGEITDHYITDALPMLNKGEQVRLLSRLEPINFAPGATIIKQGDPATHFYILVKGRVDIAVRHESGAEIVVNHLEAGSYFGEMGILEGGRRTATVRAAPDSEVVVMQLERDAFVGLVKNSEMTKDQIAALIRQRTISLSLSQVGVKATSPDMKLNEKVLTFKPDEMILRRSDSFRGMYIITKGTVDVMEVLLDNHERLVKTLQVGEFFGARNSILQSQPRAIVRSGRPAGAEVVFIEQSVMDQMAAQNPNAEKAIVSMVTGVYESPFKKTDGKV